MVSQRIASGQRDAEGFARVLEADLTFSTRVAGEEPLRVEEEGGAFAVLGCVRRFRQERVPLEDVHVEPECSQAGHVAAVIVQEEDRRSDRSGGSEERRQLGDDGGERQDSALAELEMVARVGTVSTVALMRVLSDDCKSETY